MKTAPKTTQKFGKASIKRTRLAVRTNVRAGLDPIELKTNLH